MPFTSVEPVKVTTSPSLNLCAVSVIVITPDPSVVAMGFDPNVPKNVDKTLFKGDGK